MRRVLALFAVAALALVACGDDGDDVGTGDDVPATEPGAAADDPLAGRTFVAPADEANGLVEGTELRVTFESGSLGLQAGCNQMSGGYVVEGDTLTVQPLAGTEMGCDPERMDQDTQVAAFFAEPVTWALDGDVLTLTAADGSSYVLTDVEVASPDADLVGPTWALDTLVDGDAASSLPAGVTASLTFADDGTYQVDTGCNTGNGSWTTPEGGGPTSYEIGPPAITRRACTEDGASEVEAAMLAVLDGLVTAETDEQRLTITKAAQALGFTAS